MKQAIRASLAVAALGVALLSSPHTARADGDDTALTNVVALASQRLALAEPVARWKWANHKAIEDRPREAALLTEVEKRAVQAGVDPAFARTFFEDQITASKDVQNALFATWRTTRPPEGAPPDLATSTRPALDRLTQKMLSGLQNGNIVVTSGGIVGTIVAVESDDTLVLRVKPDNVKIQVTRGSVSSLVNTEGKK